MIMNASIKFMEDNVNCDDVGIQSVDARRIHNVEDQAPIAGIPPPPNLVCQEPPKISKQMRSGQSGNSVPKDAARLLFSRMVVQYSRKIGESLRVNVYFCVTAICQALDLLQNHALGAMLPIQKRRYHCEAQSREPSEVRRVPPERTPPVEQPAPVLEYGTGYPVTATDKRS